MRRKAFAIAALATTLAGTALAAGPVILEESAIIPSPDPSFQTFPVSVATEGNNWIIAVGKRVRFTQDPEPRELTDYAAFLFRRDGRNTWSYVRTLVQTTCDESEVGEDSCPISVAIRDDVAAISAGQLHVFRRTNVGPGIGIDWVAEPGTSFTGPGDVAVGTGAIATSHPVCEGLGIKAHARNSSGVWNENFSITSDIACDLWGVRGKDVDMSLQNRWIASEAEWPNFQAHIFEPSGTSWTQTATLTSPLGSTNFASRVSIDDNRAFASGPLEAPIHIFNNLGGAWSHAVDVAPPDSLMRGAVSAIKSRGYVFAAFPNDPHRGGSVSVFRANTEEVVKLVSSMPPQASPSVRFGTYFDAYPSHELFSHAVVSGPGGVLVYEWDGHDRTPAPTQDDFELGNAASWTPLAGSNFSVVTAGSSRVYRQMSLTGDAGAFATNINWTNQAIEADVKPTATNGADRWVGLVVRRTDASNYYYATLRQSNVLSLRKMVNGTYVSLASVAVPFTLNRNYRLRLEAVGTRLRAYIDGRLVAEASDTALTRGHAGVQMHKASADFDNVVLSHDPHLTLLDHRTPYAIDGRWNFALGSWSSVYPTPDRGRLVQQDTAGDARAFARVSANDQIVQVGATATSFAAGTGDRWFGVIARYVDAGNFYYVTVRRDNTISLRKLVNGTVHVLDSAPLTVAAGTKYALRLEAIGTSLRAYVGGNLVLEANDSSHATGKYGLAMYKTAATFDDLLVWEP
jgi:hypothetical protein